MNNLIIISIITTIIILFIYNIIKKNIFNNNPLTSEDIKKNNNKQLLLIGLLSLGGVYGSLYTYENKLLDNIVGNNMEVKKSNYFRFRGSNCIWVNFLPPAEVLESSKNRF